MVTSMYCGRLPGARTAEVIHRLKMHVKRVGEKSAAMHC